MIDNKDFNENISDEILAAYIDGNATPEESSLIENAFASDSMLSESLNLISDTISFGTNFNWDLHRGDYGFWELGLTPLVTEADLIVAADSIDDVSTPMGGDSFYVQNMTAFNINDESLSCDITDNSDYGEMDEGIDDNIEDFDNDSLI